MSILALIAIVVILVCQALAKDNDDDHPTPQAPPA
jgi:hypothetical protein